MVLLPLAQLARCILGCRRIFEVVHADPVYAAFGELEGDPPPDPTGTACNERGLASDRDHLLLSIADTGCSFHDEDIVNKMPVLSGFIFDHFPNRLNIVEPGVFL